MFGKKEDKVKEKVKEKKKSGILLPLAALAAGVVAFTGLDSMQNSLIEQPDLSDVVVAKNAIAENKFIDKGQAKEWFKVIQVNSDAVADGAYTTLEDIEKELPAYVNTDTSKNSMITGGIWNRMHDMEKDYQNRAEAGFRVDSIDKAVSGTIRAGDYITIRMIDKDTGEESGSFEHIYVSGAFTGDGASIANDDTVSSASIFNIWIDSSQLAEFNKLLEKASVRVSLD